MLDLLLWIALHATPATPSAPVPPRSPTVETPSADANGAMDAMTPAQKESAIRQALSAKMNAVASGPEAEPNVEPAPEKAKPEKAEPPAPSLSRSSLCSDLTRTAKDQAQTRAKLVEERKAMEQERARLEMLVKQIEEARASLRDETQRLEKLTSGASSAPAVAGRTAQGSGYDKKQIDSLSRSLKSMKPEQAAALMTRVDRTLAVELLRGMKPNDAGKLLAQLKPDMAAELMAEVATPAYASGGSP